jgi:hypothetical protein
MAELVKNLYFTAAITMGGTRYQEGKLFLGVLGFEYSLPPNLFTGQVVTFDVSTSPEPGKPSPRALQYSFINRTGSPDDVAYSDAILPVYLRFEPDLRQPLNDAAEDVPSGADYMQQNITIENPIVQIEGKEERKLPNGASTFVDVIVELSLPINPKSARNVTLGVQSGVFCFLGKVRP